MSTRDRKNKIEDKITRISAKEKKHKESRKVYEFIVSWLNWLYSIG